MLTAHEAVGAGCETAGNSAYWSCDVCGKYFSDAEGTTEIEADSWVLPASGHDWEEVTYTWATDDSYVTALKACRNDHSHDISETVGTDYAVMTEPGCESSGTI